MKDVLHSLKPPVQLPISNDVQVSNAGDSKTNLKPDETNKEPESEDEVQATSEKSRRQQAAPINSAAGFEVTVSTVRADTTGRAYLAECDVVFPQRDEVRFHCV
jgi:hypothetical protein